MRHSFAGRDNMMVLSPMTQGQSELYRRLRNANLEYFFSGKHISEKDQRIWYEKYLADDSQIMFSIMGNDTFIGGCGLYHIDREKRMAEFGRIVIDENYRGAGKQQLKLRST